MKNIILCTILVFLCLGRLSAQNKVALGYCEDKLGGTFVAQDPMPHEFGAAVYLPAEILDKYVGSSINQIDFAIGDVAGEIMTVFVTRELEGRPILSKKTADIKKGWNSVSLSNGYTIKKGDNLYVGYRYYTTEETVNSEVMIFDFHQGTIPGTNWFSQDNKWWKVDTNTINFDLAIRAFAEGISLPETDVGARNLRSPSVIVKDKPNTYSFTMRNYGIENVNKIKFNVLANGEIYDTEELSGLDFPNNKEMSVKLEGITFPKEGNNILGIDITEVNGKEDSDKKDNRAKTHVYSIGENARPVKRNVLFEEYTTERDANSLAADSVYSIAMKQHDNVKWVKHHLSDKFLLDKESDYTYLFENNKPFYPAVLVDRNTFNGLQERGPAYFVGHEKIVEDLFSISSDIVSYVLPQASAVYDSSSRQVKINISIEPEVIEMPLQKDLRLTLYLVEDGIKSATQTGNTNFVQNGVIREIVTQAWGDPIDISKGNVTKEFICNIPAEWNAENMRVVAFVNNFDSKDPENCIVYNTCETLFDTSAGIIDIESDYRDVRVWCENGRISVPEGFKIGNIYDATGSEVQHVSEGIYFVRIVSENGVVYTKKIMIR